MYIKGVNMADKKQKDESGGTKDYTISFRVDSELATKLEKEATEIKEKTGYGITKSDVARRIIIEYYNSKNK
jgi:hypothetical protein